LEDGWVPIEIMLKFKRLANLTTDADVIVTALEESKLVEVSTCSVPYSSLINWWF
jgi:lupus La protein